jgi:Uncharacterized conserved protein
MGQTIGIRHESVEVKLDFDRYTRNLEASLGRFDDSFYEGIEAAPDKVRDRIEKAAGEEGLMIFAIRDHGRLLSLYGTPKKAKQYVIGNPLIAVEMTRHDLRAGLYAPLRIFVYETEDGSTRVEYDLPSSLFGQFDDPEVVEVARSLDAKLANVIKKAELAAKGAMAR